MLKVVQQNNGESACVSVFASPDNHTQLMLHAVMVSGVIVEQLVTVRLQFLQLCRLFPCSLGGST